MSCCHPDGSQIGFDYCLDAQKDVDAINVIGEHYEDVFLAAFERAPVNNVRL